MREAHRYAYEDIILLALLVSTRRLPIGWVPGLAPILRNIRDSAAAEVSKLIANGQEPLICSEFVYRVYEQANPNDKYHIFIVGADGADAGLLSLHTGSLAPSITALAASREDVAALADLQVHAQSFLRKYNVAKNVRIRPESAVSTLAAPNFVTPHDLQLSPNLHPVGTLVA